MREASINFAMSVIFLCPYGKTRLPHIGFHKIWYLSIFSKNLPRKFQISLKSEKKKRVLYMKTIIHFWSHLTQFFLRWKMFETHVVEKIKRKTYIFWSLNFSCRLQPNVEKYCKFGEATDDNMAHAYFTLGNTNK